MKALLLAIALTGCYDAGAVDCTVTCAGPDECASGQTCGSDGLCAAPSVAGHCASLTGSDQTDGGKVATDAAVDAAPDGGNRVPLHLKIDGEGKVTQLTGNEPVSMNYWGFTPRIYGQLREHFTKFLKENGADMKKECYIPNTVNDIILAGQGKVKVLKSNDPWFGVTYREDHSHVVASVKQLVKEGKYPEKLWP